MKQTNEKKYKQKKTIVFMFYCKDVKYDMCELGKNHEKIKYAKNLRSWLLIQHFVCLLFAWRSSKSIKIICYAYRIQKSLWLVALLQQVG